MGGFIKWVIARCWKNFGVVVPNRVYRSGQFGITRLRFMYWLLKPNLVVGMNISPKVRRGVEAKEVEFFSSRRVLHIFYDFSASGLMKKEDVDKFNSFVNIIKSYIVKDKKVWIHCAGGKDRTGGLIGFLILSSIIPGEDKIGNFINQCCFHKIPYSGWLDIAFSPLSGRNTDEKQIFI